LKNYTDYIRSIPELESMGEMEVSSSIHPYISAIGQGGRAAKTLSQGSHHPY